MRVAILAVGSRGDIQPCVALAARLVERGHEAVVVAPERYSDLVTGVGAEVAPMAFDPMEIVNSEAGQELLTEGGAIGFLRNFRPIVEPLVEQVMRDCLEGSRGADVVVASPLGGLGRHISEALGVPHVLMHFQPSEPTGEFANSLLKGARLPAPLSKASYVAIERVTDLIMRPLLKPARRSVLGLGPTGGAFRLDRRDRVPVLVTVSPHVVPRPRDWPAHIYMTGPWSLDASGSVGAELGAFVAAGPAPLWVGFGSMSPEYPAATARLFVQAARRVGLRIVIQGLPVEDDLVGDDLLVVGEADHAAAFPHVAAVVHHGGAGTTAMVMRSGVPGVVCPFFGDQPYWGRRVAELGVGPDPIAQKDLTLENVTRTLRRATTDREIARRAASLGLSLRAEDGAGRGARILEQLVG